MPRLQVLNGKRQGAVYDVAQGSEHVIGHRQSASITIDDPWVSWDHARVFFNEEDRTCWIEDLGSTNGTYVNCVRVKREPLRHEDIVFLGKTHVIFLSPAEEHQEGVEPIFGSSSEGEKIPLSSASQAGAEILPPGSSADPFSGSDARLPLRDPFQSAPSQANRALADRPRDPFSGSGVDPFSAGPDYAAMNRTPAPPPPPAGSGSFRGLLDPEREARSLSETNSDDNALTANEVSAGLHLSRLGDEDDLDVSGPSAAEISRLITGSRNRPDTETGPPPGSEASTRRKPSPMAMSERRPPTGNMQRPSPPKTLSGRIPKPDTAAAAPPPRSDPFGESRRMSGPNARPPIAANRQPPPATPAGDDLSMPQDLGKLAFERARLEDMVRRLRAALDAASQQNPQAVQSATQRLRDQELARQARRIAELEQQTAELRVELEAKQDELDQVTEDMIDKEDAIDRLQTQVDRLSSRVAVPPRPGPSVQGGASSYGSLPL